MGFLFEDRTIDQQLNLIEAQYVILHQLKALYSQKNDDTFISEAMRPYALKLLKTFVYNERLWAFYKINGRYIIRPNKPEYNQYALGSFIEKGRRPGECVRINELTKDVFDGFMKKIGGVDAITDLGELFDNILEGYTQNNGRLMRENEYFIRGTRYNKNADNFMVAFIGANILFLISMITYIYLPASIASCIPIEAVASIPLAIASLWYIFNVRKNYAEASKSLEELTKTNKSFTQAPLVKSYLPRIPKEASEVCQSVENDAIAKRFPKYRADTI